MSELHIINHPMICHKLTRIRDVNTGAKDFRELLREIAMLMGYEVTRDLPLTEVEIETPMERTVAYEISGKKLAIVPILRAGLGMVDGLLSLLPVAKVGHIGLYRDHDTHRPVFYYCKLPEDIDRRMVIVTDPMLATGGSASGSGHLHRLARPSTESAGLHPAWAGRRGRSHFRHKVGVV